MRKPSIVYKYDLSKPITVDLVLAHGCGRERGTHEQPVKNQEVLITLKHQEVQCAIVVL
jgi:hypothetical protein